MKRTLKKSQVIVFAVLVIGMLFGNLLILKHEEIQQDNNLTIKLSDLVTITDGRTSQNITHLAYSVSYNVDWNLPNWVAYELTASETIGDCERCNSFSPDPELIGDPVVHKDYSNNPGKYDRGHMAPAADMKWSEQAMRESFYTTNICPQNANLNRGDWNDIEELVRDYAQKFGSVYVVCGPIVSDTPNHMGNYQRIAIPSAFYKVLLRRIGDSWTTIGFVCDNVAGSKPIMSYVKSVDDIEFLADIDLFSFLPDDIETMIERDMNLENWTLQNIEK